jgi:hypothetical protein
MFNARDPNEDQKQAEGQAQSEGEPEMTIIFGDLGEEA